MAWRRHFSRYLTVNDRARDFQIYCTDCGCTEVEPGEEYPPYPYTHPAEYTRNLGSRRRLGEFQIVYITRGSGRFRCAGGKQQTVGAGQVFLLFPGIWHAYRPDPETGWDEYWIGFAGEYPEHLVEKGFLDPSNPVLEIGYSETLLNEYIKTFEIASSEAPGFQYELGATTMSIIATILARSERARQHTDTSEIVDRAKFEMEEQLFKGLDLETLTAKLGISASSFYSHFKQYTGLTPYQYFLQLKVNHAKYLLRDGRHSVKQVAHELSFEDQFYFSRLFKKKTGVTPSEWQRGELRPSDEV